VNINKKVRMCGTRIARTSECYVASLVLSACLMFLQAQETQTLNSQEQNVYSGTWSATESKSCNTYSGQPHLLLCNDYPVGRNDSFEHLIANGIKAGMSVDQAYHQAFMFALEHSQRHLVIFTNSAWPHEQFSRKPGNMSVWRCAMNLKVIPCSLVGQDGPSAVSAQPTV
jgi:hypothetical protein